MKEQDLVNILKFECRLEGDGGDISGAYTSDLLSDVMGNAPDDSVLITIQAHKNTVAVADLAGIKAVILCNGREPDEGMLEAARKAEIGLYCTSASQFQVSCAVGKVLGV